MKTNLYEKMCLRRKDMMECVYGQAKEFWDICAKKWTLFRRVDDVSNVFICGPNIVGK